MPLTRRTTRNIRLNPPLTLPSLPDELLSIIFEALDFGANKKDFAALQATCKALQSALKVHPGNIELEGIWTTSHIEGLCKAMPEMISLSYRRDEDNQELQGKYAPQKKTIHPKQFPMFSCRKLRNLDLSFIENKYSTQWTSLKKLPKLPRLRLTSLCLPKSYEMPDALCQMVGSLKKLKQLDCSLSGFWPSTKLCNLEALAVGGGYRADSSTVAAFCEDVLGRLCKLTRLDLTMSYASYIHLIHPTDFQLAQVPPLRDFKIAGYAPPGTLVSLLSSFSQLEALELDVGRPKGLLPGSDSSHTLNGELLRFSSGSLRKLSLKCASVDFAEVCIPDGLALVHLKYAPCGSVEQLKAPAIAKIAGLTRLTALDLRGWTTWHGDLSPLRGLPLRRLTCSNVCMLVDVLHLGTLPSVGVLGSLTTITVNPMRFRGEQWDKRIWQRARDLTEDALLVLASEALLRLPNLSTLTWFRQRYEHDTDAFFSKRVIQIIISLSPQAWINTAKRPGEVHYTRSRGGD